MENNIRIFTSPLFGEIRTVGTADAPMFCLADVCRALGLNGGAKNVKARLDPKGVDIVNTPTEGGIQQMNFIDEPNLYKCIFQSRKKEAQVFQDWVTSEVLPAIRKTGGYMVAKPDESPEEIMARALLVANDTINRSKERIAALEQENRAKAVEIETKTERIARQDETIKASAPKVDYYDGVLQSVDSCTTTQVGSIIGMGANKLNKKLKEIGLQYKQSGQYLLRAPYNSWKLHTTRIQTFTHADGRMGSSMYTVWTQRGVRFIVALNDNDWNIRRALAAIKGEQPAEIKEAK